MQVNFSGEGTSKDVKRTPAKFNKKGLKLKQLKRKGKSLFGNQSCILLMLSDLALCGHLLFSYFDVV
jgi:hypothetical protein